MGINKCKIYQNYKKVADKLDIFDKGGDFARNLEN